MIIGVPKEIKTKEDRVAITPQGVKSLVSQGHKVIIEKSAGVGSGFTDEEYISQGATFDKNGIFAYVQASDNAGILMESCSPTSDGETSGFQRFMESSVYISEVK